MEIFDKLILKTQSIGSPTYDSIQDYVNYAGTAGSLTLSPFITDAGGGTINIIAGDGLIRESNSHLSPIKFFNWSASLGISIPTNTTRYIGVEYNSGSPQLSVRTTENWNYHTDFPLGLVINESGTLHIFENGRIIPDIAGHAIKRVYKTSPLTRSERDGGLILGETGTRNVTVSTGILWDRLNEFNIPVINTSISGTFDIYYRDSGSGFTKVAAQTQWPNTQYDNGTGTLATMTNNRYAVLWCYIETDGDFVMVYGRDEYTSLASAETESTPGTIPERLLKTAKLIGRFIFQKSAVTTSQIDSVFTITFTPTATANHANLSNLDYASSGHTDFANSGANSNITSLSGLTTPLTVGQGGTGTATQFTQGSIIFAGASGVYSEDNTKLFWDDTNNRVGVGLTTPIGALDILKTVTITTGAIDYGIRNRTNYNASENFIKYGLYQETSVGSGVDNTSGIIGINSHLIHDSSSVTTPITNYRATGIINSGQSPNWYLYRANNVTGAGFIDNLYGLYISQLSKGILNWAIYTAGNTNSYFNGNIGISTPSYPVTALHAYRTDSGSIYTPITGTSQTITNILSEQTITSVPTTSSLVSNLFSTLIYTPTISGTKTYYGIRSALVVDPITGSGGSTTSLVGGRFEVDVQSAITLLNVTGTRCYASVSSTTPTIHGVSSEARNNFTGTVTDAYGGRFSVTTNAAGIITNGYCGDFQLINYSIGKIVNGHGIRVQSPSNPSGIFEYIYGIKIEDQRIGTIEPWGQTYGIYQEGIDDINYFNGNVGIGLNNPTATLHITTGLSSPAQYVFKASSGLGDIFYIRDDKRIIYDDGNQGAGKVLTSDANGVATWQTAASGGTQKYATTFTPGTVTVPNTIVHSLGTTDFSVTLWDVTTGEIVYAKVDNRTTSNVDITFTTNPAGDVRIVVIG